jgi:hypothetical protein
MRLFHRHKALRAAVLALLLTLVVALPMASAARSGRSSGSGGPLDAYPCQEATWFTVEVSQTGAFFDGLGRLRENLQVDLDALVDPTRVEPNGHQLYCGKVESVATDTLYEGCLTFEVYAEEYSNGVYSSGGNGSAYHCTAKQYLIVGGQWSTPCSLGSYVYGATYVKEFPNDYVPTEDYYC